MLFTTSFKRYCMFAESLIYSIEVLYVVEIFDIKPTSFTCGLSNSVGEMADPFRYFMNAYV
jgi:hypothetical protein